ncbi:MAG: sensor histidine kinase, partial [Acidobacteriota bacterium]
YTLRLEQKNRDLQEFAFVATHDLQEPLRKIQAFADRVRHQYEACFGGTGSDYLDRMERAANRMQELVRSILRYTRLSTNAEEFTLVDLNRVVMDVIEESEGLIRRTGARIEVENLPAIEGDAQQLRRLFHNLIENGLKFHGAESPFVRLHTEYVVGERLREDNLSDGALQIYVEDNGIGFDQKYTDRIFSPFQRLHAQGVYEGTGIGLSICRKIVECHGGTISALSAPGKGSTFIVTLPVKQRMAKRLSLCA